MQMNFSCFTRCQVEKFLDTVFVALYFQKLKTCYRVGRIRSICWKLRGDLNDDLVPQHKLAHFPEIFPE